MKLWIARDKYDQKVGLYAEEPNFRKTVYHFESRDLYGSAYLAYADDVEVNHKDREVEIKE